jgi:hypothetical protein
MLPQLLLVKRRRLVVVGAEKCGFRLLRRMGGSHFALGRERGVARQSKQYGENRNKKTKNTYA